MTFVAPDDEASVAAVFRLHVSDRIDRMQRLSGGVFSRAFGVHAGGERYVVRLCSFPHAAEAYAKDEYAGRQFASPALRIPRIVARGRIGDDQFAIGERIAGRTQQELTPSERRAQLTATLDALDAVARVDVSASCGYGHWNGDGIGTSASWHAYLAAIVENEAAGFFRDWHALFRDSFLERDVYEAVYRTMLRLAASCPEGRALIHNDFQWENVLTEGLHITGVIDWANALYGDPLYEIARLLWWSGWPGWWYDDVEDVLRERYGGADGFEVRVACYTCHVVLDDLRYYATMGNRAEYERARDRILAFVAGT